MDKIVAFDVETPNHKNDKICSIGLTLIENGYITDTQHYLINPECEFNYLNIQIHGIRPEDVMHAPVFPEVWDNIRELFQTHLVVAHNANFDLCVLRKALLAYGITESLVYYVDTLAVARAMVKEADNHRLSTLCECFGIPLMHHNAKSDSYACAKLLCCFVEAGAILDKFTRTFKP